MLFTTTNASTCWEWMSTVGYVIITSCTHLHHAGAQIVSCSSAGVLVSCTLQQRVRVQVMHTAPAKEQRVRVQVMHTAPAKERYESFVQNSSLVISMGGERAVSRGLGGQAISSSMALLLSVYPTVVCFQYDK